MKDCQKESHRTNDGCTEGDSLGLADGSIGGVLDGNSLRTTEGCIEGDLLGTDDGSIDGGLDGTALGTDDGCMKDTHQAYPKETMNIERD